MDILALDFDGVICDSAGEAAVSGWKCAGRLWPHLFQGDAPDQIIEKFRQVRPVMETGYESALLVRLLWDGCSVDHILQDAPSLLSGLIERESMAIHELVRVFGQTRDTWMADDLEGWIDTHAFYDGMVDAVNRSDPTVYIITTKERRFVIALCRAADLRIPEAHIFGLESGKKQDVLAELARRHKVGCVHFVEDRLQTLIQTAEAVDFDVRLYFADWGYHTMAEHDLAVKMPNIEVLAQDQFPQFVRKPSFHYS